MRRSISLGLMAEQAIINQRQADFDLSPSEARQDEAHSVDHSPTRRPSSVERAAVETATIRYGPNSWGARRARARRARRRRMRTLRKWFRGADKNDDRGGGGNRRTRSTRNRLANLMRARADRRANHDDSSESEDETDSVPWCNVSQAPQENHQDVSDGEDWSSTYLSHDSMSDDPSYAEWDAKLSGRVSIFNSNTTRPRQDGLRRNISGPRKTNASGVIIGTALNSSPVSSGTSLARSSGLLPQGPRFSANVMNQFDGGDPSSALTEVRSNPAQNPSAPILDNANGIGEFPPLAARGAAAAAPRVPSSSSLSAGVYSGSSLGSADAGTSETTNASVQKPRFNVIYEYQKDAAEVAPTTNHEEDHIGSFQRRALSNFEKPNDAVSSPSVPPGRIRRIKSDSTAGTSDIKASRARKAVPQKPRFKVNYENQGGIKEKYPPAPILEDHPGPIHPSAVIRLGNQTGNGEPRALANERAPRVSRSPVQGSTAASASRTGRRPSQVPRFKVIFEYQKNNEGPSTMAPDDDVSSTANGETAQEESVIGVLDDFESEAIGNIGDDSTESDDNNTPGVGRKNGPKRCKYCGRVYTNGN